MRVSTLGYYVVATLAAVALHAAALPVLNERDAIQAHLDTRGDMDDPIDARGVAGDSFDTRGIQTIEDDDHAQARGMDDFDNDEIMDARDFDSPEADSFIDARGIGDSETDENAKRRFNLGPENPHNHDLPFAKRYDFGPAHNSPKRGTNPGSGGGNPQNRENPPNGWNRGCNGGLHCRGGGHPPKKRAEVDSFEIEGDFKRGLHEPDQEGSPHGRALLEERYTFPKPQHPAGGAPRGENRGCSLIKGCRH